MPRIELKLGSVITLGKRRQQMTSLGSGEKMCNLQIRYHFQYNSCVKDQLTLPEGYS